MKILKGFYHNGDLRLDESLETQKPVKVTITIDEEQEENELNFSDFSFLQTQKLLRHCKSSFSDEVIRERRAVFDN